MDDDFDFSIPVAKRKNGRNKGACAEREVAALCKNWWETLEPDSEFVRTPMSGGWSTAKVRAHMKASGDISTTAEKWPFCVEVKRRETWNQKSLFAGRPGPVWDWWWQTQKAAAEMKAEPMLWLRHNHTPWLVMVRCVLVQPLILPVQPVNVWTRGDLASVDYGAMPICYHAKCLLKCDPELFLERV